MESKEEKSIKSRERRLIKDEDPKLIQILHSIRNFKRLTQTEIGNIQQMTILQIMEIINVYNDVTEDLIEIVNGLT